MRYFKHVVLVAVTLITGCATTGQAINTPSGNPEVTVYGISRKEAIDRIVSAKVAAGLRIRSVTEYSAEFAGPINNLLTSALYGSRYDSTPEGRVTYTVVDHAGGIKVYSRTAIVTNPGSAFERVNDVTRQDARVLQNELESFNQGRTTSTASSVTPTSTTTSSKDGAYIGKSEEEFLKALRTETPSTQPLGASE